ncbi:MAG: helix-turn-helix domain-containing protein [Rhodocyclales bacterium]|nr:helix-turn-helix domain-containing protein [Rhodocyclales bacterium]
MNEFPDDKNGDAKPSDAKHGVQSLEVGMDLLKVMVRGQRSMMLKDIAAAAGMPASKAHRYLVSLIRAGLVEQDPLSSRYHLGPFALNLGWWPSTGWTGYGWGWGRLRRCATRSTKPRPWRCGARAGRWWCAGSARAARSL